MAPAWQIPPTKADAVESAEQAYALLGAAQALSAEARSPRMFSVTEKRWSWVRLLASVLAVAAVATQLRQNVDHGRSVVNFLSFFTIESNVYAALILGWSGASVLTGRRIHNLAQLRGAATLYMTVTGLVYAVLLRNVDVQTDQAWVNTVLHYVMPVVLLADWVVYPPTRHVDRRKAWWWLAFPVAYLVYSLIRGAAVDWYPYPFLDVGEHGLVGVLIGSAFLLVAAAALILGLVRAAAWRRIR